MTTIEQQVFAATKSEELSKSIEAGLNFLQEKQLATGEFNGYAYLDIDLLNPQIDSSIFPTAIAALALRHCQHPTADSVRAEAVRFLKNEMEFGGYWRYYSSANKLRDFIPLDVDDTCCASAALRAAGVNFADNTRAILGARSSRELFYTWIIPRLRISPNWEFWKVVFKQNWFKVFAFFHAIKSADPRDVDGTVNANALFYIGRRLETEKVIAYLKEIVFSKRESSCDKWHHSPLNFHYALSNNVYGGVYPFSEIRELALERIRSFEEAGGRFGKHLVDTALAASALMNWREHGPELDRAIEYLLSEQHADGGWEKCVYYYGGSFCGKAESFSAWASEEMTTVLCVEAISRYERVRAGMGDSKANTISSVQASC